VVCLNPFTPRTILSCWSFSHVLVSDNLTIFPLLHGTCSSSHPCINGITPFSDTVFCVSISVLTNTTCLFTEALYFCPCSNSMLSKSWKPMYVYFCFPVKYFVQFVSYRHSYFLCVLPTFHSYQFLLFFCVFVFLLCGVFGG
jgi:hypothetical protein